MNNIVMLRTGAYDKQTTTEPYITFNGHLIHKAI